MFLFGGLHRHPAARSATRKKKRQKKVLGIVHHARLLRKDTKKTLRTKSKTDPAPFSRPKRSSYLLTHSDHLGRFVLELRHGITDRCTDVGGIANDVLMTVEQYIIARDLFLETYCRRQMARIVKQEGL